MITYHNLTVTFIYLKYQNNGSYYDVIINVYIIHLLNSYGNQWIKIIYIIFYFIIKKINQDYSKIYETV